MGSIARHFSPLLLAARIGLCIILFLFVGELVLLSQHFGEGAEHISGSILDGMSIDKSQFVSTKDIGRYNILTEKQHTISFTLRLTNRTGSNIRAGSISISFQNQGQFIADPVITSFDLTNGVSRLLTIAWMPSVDLESLSCIVITTVYNAANDQLGSLTQPLNIT
jgi:hypothetical protein